MLQQGRCTLPADDAGRVLDRLAGLEHIISSETVRQALLNCGRVNGRACTLTHEVMLWVVLAMGVLTDLPIRQVFKHARRLRVGEDTPARSSLCEARHRLGVEPVRQVFRRVVRPLATPETPGAFYRGFRLVGCDGTVMDAPDSEANAAAFHRATGSRGEGAFPQVRKVSLVEIGTHVEFAFAAGGWQDSENALAELLFDQVPADALLLEDRGFFSYSAWKKLLARKLQLLVRVKQETFDQWYAGLLWEMQKEIIEPRRNRINPRVIKRKMSKWMKKRPEHRHIPPLKKRFAETVVMLN